MVRHVAIAALLVACSSPAKKTKTLKPAGPTVVQPSPPAPAPSDEATEAAIRHLNAFGKLHGERLEAEFPTVPTPGDGEINAFGPCMRPSEEARTALRQRLITWLDKETPDEVHEHSGEDLDVLFGCAERNGIVVDLQVDRTKRATQKTVGHWWILRIGEARVDRIAEHTGLARGEFASGANEVTLATFALADLDKDGLLDVIANRTEQVSAPMSQPAIAVFGTRGKATAFAPLGPLASLELAPGQHPAVRAAVVTLLRVADDKPPKYTCVLETGYVETCAAAGLAKRHDAAVEAAQRLAQILPGSSADVLPDRDELDGLLATLGARPQERAPLLALVPPTPGLRRVVRAIAELVAKRPVDDERSLHTALRGELGDAACSEVNGDNAAARAWLAKKAPTARRATLRMPCAGLRGTVVEVRWLDATDDTAWSGAILFVPSGAAAPTVIAEAVDTEWDATHGPQGETVTVATYRRGKAVIALTLVQGKQLIATADGVVIGRSPASGVPNDRAFSHYRGGDTLVLQEMGELKMWWHASETALVKVGDLRDAALGMPAGTTPLMKRIVERERRDLAWQALVAVDENMLENDAEYRDNVLRALDLVGAAPMLRAEIEKAKAKAEAEAAAAESEQLVPKLDPFKQTKP